MNMKKLLVASLLILPTLNQQVAQAASDYVQNAEAKVTNMTQALTDKQLTEMVQCMGLFAKKVADELQSDGLIQPGNKKNFDPSNMSDEDTIANAVELANYILQVNKNSGQISSYPKIYNTVKDNAGFWTALGITKNDDEEQESMEKVFNKMEEFANKIFALEKQEITNYDEALNGTATTLTDILTELDPYGIISTEMKTKWLKSKDGRCGSLKEQEARALIQSIYSDTAEIGNTYNTKLKEKQIPVLGIMVKLENMGVMDGVQDTSKVGATLAQINTKLDEYFNQDISINKLSTQENERKAIIAKLGNWAEKDIETTTANDAQTINLSQKAASKGKIEKIQTNLEFDEKQYPLLPTLNNITGYTSNAQDLQKLINQILHKQGVKALTAKKEIKVLAVLGGATTGTDDGVAQFLADNLKTIVNTKVTLGTTRNEIKKALEKTTQTNTQKIIIDKDNIKPILEKVLDQSPLSQTDLETLKHLTGRSTAPLGGLGTPFSNQDMLNLLQNNSSRFLSISEIATMTKHPEAEVEAWFKLKNLQARNKNDGVERAKLATAAQS